MAGRRQDPTLGPRILAAAGSLLAEAGVTAFSVEALARTINIPKSTIYSRWESRSALLDAVLAAKMTSRPVPGTSRRTLVAMLRDDLRLARSPDGRAIAQLLLATQDTGAADVPKLRERLELRRAQYREVLAGCATALDVEVVESQLDVAVAVALSGVWAQSVLLGIDVAGVDAENLADAVLGVLS